MLTGYLGRLEVDKERLSNKEQCPTSFYGAYLINPWTLETYLSRAATLTLKKYCCFSEIQVELSVLNSIMQLYGRQVPQTGRHFCENCIALDPELHLHLYSMPGAWESDSYFRGEETEV